MPSSPASFYSSGYYHKRNKLKLYHEHINNQPDHSFLYRHFRLPAFHGIYHAHPEYELNWVIKSKGQRCVGNVISYFEEGELVLLGPNLPHYWKNEKTKKGKLLAESICIQFSGDFLGADFFHSPEMKPILALLQRSSAGILFRGSTADECRRLMMEMEDAPAFERVIQLLVVLKKLAETKEFRQISPVITMQENITDVERIRKIYHFISNNYREPISLAKVARLINMTPPSFCRYFKKVTRRTLFDIIGEYRIQRACNLLLNTDKSISDICFDCGYSVPAHFNNQFKKQMKLTPLQYRKKFAVG